MKKTIILVLAVALVMMLMPTMAIAASTIYVSTTTELNDAISAAADGDTIYIYDGSYTLDQTALTKNLTIIGESEDGVVLTPPSGLETEFYRYAVPAESAWLHVASGYTLDISYLTMDGENNNIAFAIRGDGDLNVTEVTIKNVYRSDNIGCGIGIMPTGKLVATNVTMSNIDRIGIYASSDADIDGFDYTGKGDSPKLDYAINVSPTRDGTAVRYVVNVTNSTIRDCGVSSSGWGSSAFYVNSYYYCANGGTDTQIATLNVDSSNIYGCEVGVYVGYDDAYKDYGIANFSNTNFFDCGRDFNIQSLNNTTVETNGNYYGGGAPDVYFGEGDSIIGIDTYVTTPIPMDQDTDVTADVDPTFMIIIPAAVDFGSVFKDTGVQTQLFPVQATGVVLEPGCWIDVTVTGPFKMYDLDGTGTVELAFDLENEAGAVSDGGIFATFTADDTEDGTISVDTAAITMAGSYKGTLVFDISYQD